MQVIPVESRRQLREFIHLPWSIYRDDPHWIPPLLWLERERLNRKKNHFFKEGDLKLFLAYDGGKPVGRLSVQVHHGHNAFHREKTGFFGLFESVNDTAVAAALISSGKEWLKGQGMETIRGPFTLHINEISGLLIHGFDSPPRMMMAYNPPYYRELLESVGFAKAKDLYAWKYNVGEIPEGPRQIADAVAAYPGLKIRTIDTRHYLRDIRTIVDVWNQAWAKNWGHIPISDALAKHMAFEMRLMADPRMILIAEVHGEPAGICIAFPDLNWMIRDLNGRLFPFGFAKFLWRIWQYRTRKPGKPGRLAILGVRPKFRGSVLGGLSVLLYVEIHRLSLKYGYGGGELSWTLEDNEKISAGIQFMGGEHYKTYRIYETAL